MTGRFQGFATRVELSASPPGLVRVWCVLHKFDLVMQAYYKAVMSEQWYSYLTPLIGYLRRQQNIITDMQTQCPLVCDIRWMNMVKVCKWFDFHRVEVMDYLAAKKPAAAPPPMWWLLLAVIQSITDRAAKTSGSLEGHVTLICEQRERINELRRSVCMDVGIIGPLSENQRREMQGAGNVRLSAKNNFAVSIEDTLAFIRGLRSWVRAIFEELPSKSKSSVLSGVASSALNRVEGIYEVVAERNLDNSANQQDLPPVLQHQLRNISPYRFQELQIHRQHLEVSLAAADVDLIEKEHRNFRDAALNEPGLGQRLDAATDKLSFRDVWSGLHERWACLSAFCGGLSTVFPGTATVESDFSIVNFEKTTGRKALTDFSLEGILQAKQYLKLRALKMSG